MAAKYGKTSVVEALLAAGAAVDLQSKYGGAFRASGVSAIIIRGGCVFCSYTAARLHRARLYQCLY
jgi:hypothetical protein